VRRVNLENLQKLNREELRARWRELFNRPAPDGLRRELMVRILAYRTQELVCGGLSPAGLRRIAELRRAFTANRNALSTDAPRIKPGTRLVRSWHGEVHQVTVVERGYEYKDRKYSSLSEVARLITGTRWNGPLFFGLRKPLAKEQSGVA
jgi:hypothetical protein